MGDKTWGIIGPVCGAWPTRLHIWLVACATWMAHCMCWTLKLVWMSKERHHVFQLITLWNTCSAVNREINSSLMLRIYRRRVRDLYRFLNFDSRCYDYKIIFSKRFSVSFESLVKWENCHLTPIQHKMMLCWFALSKLSCCPTWFALNVKASCSLCS